MSEPMHSDTSNPLSDNMIAWLKLRRELEDRITDPETRDLFHRFMQVDTVLLEEESREAFERGKTARE